MLTKEEVQIAIDAAVKPLKIALDAAEEKLEVMKNDKPEKKTAEDEEAEEKEKAKDKEEADKKSGAMDSAIATLTAEIKALKSNAMDGGAMMREFAEVQTLKQTAGAIVGQIPNEHVTQDAVAKYAIGKMSGVACDSGQELAMLKGILHARQTPTFTVDKGNAQDSADAAKSSNLDKAGL